MPAQIPLPAFRQPPGPDDPLPTVPSSPPASRDETTPPDLPPAKGPDGDDRPAPPPPSLEPPAATRTRTSSRGDGDPKAAARAVRGLLAILVGTAAALLSRSGRHLRQPTREQLADIADPLGAILARHLPAEALAPDLIDITTAAAAAHDYVLDGPIVERIPTANIITAEEIS